MREAPRPGGAFLDLLDDPRVFSSRVFLVAWFPLCVSAIIAQSPDPRTGLGPWVVAVAAATLLVLPLFLGLGRLISRVRRHRVRRAMIPAAFGLVGLARGAALVLMAEHFALVTETHAAVRLVGGVLAGVVLISAVAAVERSRALLMEMQGEARRLRGERDTARVPLDDSAVYARWIDAMRETIAAHFTEMPWTAGASAALERSGPQALTEQIARHLAAARIPARERPVSLRTRLTDRAHARRLVELATARAGGLRAPYTIAVSLAIATMHSTSIVRAEESLVTVLVVAASAAAAWMLATALERAHHRYLRRAPLGARFVAITLGLIALGLSVGVVANAVDLVLLDGERSEVARLVIGTLPVVTLLFGWSCLAIEGAASYSSLLRIENRATEKLLTRRRTERERSARQVARHFDHCIDERWVPLVRAIARDAPSWRSRETHDRVARSLAVLARALTTLSFPDAIDVIARDWEGIALVDCFVDEDVMALLAALPSDDATALLGDVRARVATAVVDDGAQVVEVTIRREGDVLAIATWHNGGH